MECRGYDLGNFPADCLEFLFVFWIIDLGHHEERDIPSEELLFGCFHFFSPKRHHQKLRKMVQFLLEDLVETNCIILKGHVLSPHLDQHHSIHVLSFHLPVGPHQGGKLVHLGTADLELPRLSVPSPQETRPDVLPRLFVSVAEMDHL